MVFGCQTRTTNILTPERAAIRRDTRGLRIAQMSGQFSWSRRWAECPLNAAADSGCLRSWKTAALGGTL